MMKHARLFGLCLLTLLSFAYGCDGCGGCGDGETPADPEERIDSLARLIPATSDAAIVVPEIGEMSEHVDRAFLRAEHFNPDARDIERAINRRIGLRLTSAESWGTAGFDPDGAMLISMVGTRPVLVAHLEDSNDFETNFVGQVRRHFDQSSPIEEREVGGTDFRVSGDGMANDMAWFYDDSTVVLVMPPFDVLDAFETGTAMAVADQLTTVDEETALADSDKFNAFQQGLGADYPIGVYFNTDSYFDRPEMEEGIELFGGLETVVESLVEWSQANAEGAGVGLRTTDRQVEIHAFASGNEQVMEDARSAFDVEGGVDAGGMLTENTAVAARSDVDFPSVFDTYLDNLPDSRRRSIERHLSRLGRNYRLDIREDVVEAFSGHNLMVFYGVGGDVENSVGLAIQGRPAEAVRNALRNSGLMINFHFADTEKMETLVQRAADFGGDHLQRRPLQYDGEVVDDIEVLRPLDLRTYPLRVYLGDDSATVATAGINEQSAYEYLTDRRDESQLGEVDELRLGAEFADADTLNGLYVNLENLRGNMRQVGPPVSGYASPIQPLRELLMTAGVDEQVFYLNTRIDFSAPLEDGEE